MTCVLLSFGAWFPQDRPISPLAQDLLSKLLTSDSATRLTADEALHHREWHATHGISHV